MTAQSKAGRDGPNSSLRQFEARQRAVRHQRNLIRLLGTKSATRHLSLQLGGCGPKACAGSKCVEACWYSHRRRSRDERPRIRKLFKRVAGGALEVRLVCGDWSRPLGSLNSLGLGTVTRRIRTLFDSLYNPIIIAVGTIKVAQASFSTIGWVCEAHMLVSGVSAAELETLFGRQRAAKRFDNRWQIRPARNLDKAIYRVLRRRLTYWQDTAGGDDAGSQRISKKQRRELYNWLSEIQAGECTVRYGCDRYFNRLAKKPRKFVRKSARDRIYPSWLEPYQFGGEKWKHRRSPYDMGYNPASKRRPKEGPSGYYDDLDKGSPPLDELERELGELE